MWRLLRRLKGDRGGGADFVGFIILFPLVLFPFVFAVQIFLYYQASSAVYSASYLTLRAAETYYAPALTDPLVSGVGGKLQQFLDTNLESQGYTGGAAGESVDIKYASSQFFELDVAYEVPIEYLASADGKWDLWGSANVPPTLPVRVHLLGRKVVR